MQILVLGGTGFIGSHLVPSLLTADHEVTVLNRGKFRNASAVVSLQADRDDAFAVKDVLASYNGSEFDVIIDTSSLCLLHSEVLLAQLPRFAGHLIHISSASVYLQCKIAKETDPIGGASIWGDYGSYKSDVDRFLLAPSNSGFLTTIYRPPYLYGANDSQDRASFIWSRSKAGLPLFIPPAGGMSENSTSIGVEIPLIQFLHVSDLVRAITESMGLRIEPGVYNIAGEEKVSLRQWVSLVAKAATLPDPAQEVPAAFTERPPRSYFPFRSTALTLDVTKLADQGFSGSIGLLEGLEKIFVSYNKKSSAPVLSETEKQMHDVEEHR